jgi:hypothetical protein
MAGWVEHIGVDIGDLYLGCVEEDRKRLMQLHLFFRGRKK